MVERIKAESLSKRFASRLVLEDVSLTACEGEILGIFGPSGSGKTTLIKLLSGVLKPDSGEVTIHDTPAVWLCENLSDPQVTAFEWLWLWASIYGLPRRKRYSAIRDILNLLELDEFRDYRIETFSNGMVRRLEAARVLLSPSCLLLADEPMAGIDYAARKRLWQYLLARRSADKCTVVLATSRAEDGEMCDRVVLLHEGHILACGTIAQLRGAHGLDAIAIKPVSKTKASIRDRGALVAREDDGILTVEIGPHSRPSDLVCQLGDEISAIHLRSSGLDSILEEFIKRRASATETLKK